MSYLTREADSLGCTKLAAIVNMLAKKIGGSNLFIRAIRKSGAVLVKAVFAITVPLKIKKILTPRKPMLTTELIAIGTLNLGKADGTDALWNSDPVHIFPSLDQ